jgi:ribosome-binding ATPase
MEDELILADLGVVERRLERLDKDLKKAVARSRAGARTSCASAGRPRDGTAAARLDAHADDAKRLRGFQFLSAKPLLLVVNLDEADGEAGRADAVRWRRPGSRRS